MEASAPDRATGKFGWSARLAREQPVSFAEIQVGFQAQSEIHVFPARFQQHRRHPSTVAGCVHCSYRHEEALTVGADISASPGA